MKSGVSYSLTFYQGQQVDSGTILQVQPSEPIVGVRYTLVIYPFMRIFDFV